MGWTHYWKRPTELPPVLFAAAVRDCRRALPKLGIPLGNIDGTGSPRFSDDVIAFNGSATSSEPFEIHQVAFDRNGRPTVRSFCKTERLPYDLCVQVALIIMKHHLGEAIFIGSDGHDNDRATACQKCQQHLGYGEDFKLADKEPT